MSVNEQESHHAKEGLWHFVTVAVPTLQAVLPDTARPSSSAGFKDDHVRAGAQTPVLAPCGLKLLLLSF